MAKEFTSHNFLKAFTLLGLTVFIAGCGARTGLRVPATTALTFQRPVGSTGAWRREIFQTAGDPPGSRIRLGGLNVLSHAAHTNGDWLSYSTQEGLFVQDWHGNVIQRVSGPNISGIGWTPDARQIAFGQGERIWKVDASSSGGPTALTPEYTGPDSLSAMSPAWTPDASRLYLIRYRTGLDPGGNPTAYSYEIWTIATNGSDLRLVHTGSPEPSLPVIAVSRDGAAVLYATGSQSSPSIVRLDLASGATSTLLANAWQPAFGASGRYLAFVRNGQVWVCDYDGSTCVNERQITDGTNDNSPSWVGG